MWPTNDPKIIEEVLEYFKLKPETIVDVQVINRDTKNKFNFITPATVKELLEVYVDLQFRITKSILKKLGKF